MSKEIEVCTLENSAIADETISSKSCEENENVDVSDISQDTLVDSEGLNLSTESSL